MTPPDEPNPLSDKVLDLALGQLPPGESAPLSARLQADPAAAAEHARWVGLRRAADAAFSLPLDPDAGARIAARVVTRVRDEEARSARPRPARRTLWLRALAVAAAAHVVVFAVLALRSAPPAGGEHVEPFAVHVPWDPAADAVAMRDESPRDLPMPAGLSDEDRFDESLRGLLAGDGEAVRPFPTPAAPRAVGIRVTSLAFAARTDDVVKRSIEARVAAVGSLETIRRSLDALAALQRPDGSFPAPAGVEASDATALATLPFLGDGHASRLGARREVVAKAVSFLRSRRAADGTVLRGGDAVLWALSEDAWLSSAFLTLPEARERAGELHALASRLAGGPTASREAGSLHALAMTAAARARVVEPPALAVPAVAVVDGWLAGDVGVADAFGRGSAILRAGNAETFRRWTAKAAGALRAAVGDDGLVRGDDPAARVAATAQAILGLQVPFRAQ